MFKKKEFLASANNIRAGVKIKTMIIQTVILRVQTQGCDFVCTVTRTNPTKSYHIIISDNIAIMAGQTFLFTPSGNGRKAFSTECTGSGAYLTPSADLKGRGDNLDVFFFKVNLIKQSRFTICTYVY